MLELLAKLRQKTGYRNKQIRKQGFIPAILYGHKVKNLPLLVKEQDFGKVYQAAGESTLIKLKIETGEEQAKKERMVLIQDIAKDPITDKTIHIDFHQVKMDEAIKVEVPLVFIGQSAAVEKENGVLIKNIQHLEIEALPQDLPHEIQVDISSLETFEDNIHVKDLKIPEKAKAIAGPKEVVASVVPPRTKEELEEMEEAPQEKVEEVEVETKEKVEKEKAGEQTEAAE